MKFCARHELNKISEQVQSYSEPIKCEIRMQLMDENYADAYELLELADPAVQDFVKTLLLD